MKRFENPSIPALAVGIAGAIAGGAALWIPWLGLVAAALTLVAVLWQFLDGRTIRFIVQASDWTRGVELYEFVLPANAVGRRRRVDAFDAARSDSRQVVHVDVDVQADGSIVIRSGTTDTLEILVS